MVFREKVLLLAWHKFLQPGFSLRDEYFKILNIGLHKVCKNTSYNI